MPNVSVVTVFHNRAGLVRATVESLLQQTYDDYEIVLVDDGSTDGTLGALRQFEGGRVRVITHANKGFTNAIADAIQSLDCRYIAIQGSGDTSHADRLRLQAAALDAQSEIVTVGAKIEVIDPASGAVMRDWGRPIARPAADAILQANPFSHGETMFRARTYRACGGYRRFFTFAQDRDLFCRMSRRGEFFRVPQTLYRRLSSVAGSVSADPAKRIQQILLSAFAVHCHREALAGRGDPLEAQGPAAALSMGRSSMASRAIWRAALRSLRQRQYANAAAYAQFLDRYDSGPGATALLALCSVLGGRHGSVEPAYQASNSAGSISRLT